MDKKQLFKGRPDFPNDEAVCLDANTSTNDTDQVYCIDTGTNEATFGAGMLKINDDGTTSASSWASKSFTGVLYGRWTNVVADVQLSIYKIETANSEE